MLGCTFDPFSMEVCRWVSTCDSSFWSCQYFWLSRKDSIDLEHRGERQQGRRGDRGIKEEERRWKWKCGTKGSNKKKRTGAVEERTEMFEAVVTELYWVTVFFNNETPISTVTRFKFSTNSGQCTTKTVYEKTLCWFHIFCGLECRLLCRQATVSTMLLWKMINLLWNELKACTT